MVSGSAHLDHENRPLVPEEGARRSRPALLIVEDEPVLSTLADDLSKRFSGDFRIISQPTAAGAIETLDRLATKNEPVALVIAGGVPDLPGVEILDHAKELNPMVKRILLVDRDYSPANPVVREMMLGRIDYHISKPWRREHTLYPAISGFLSDWAATQEEDSGGVFRIVERGPGPLSHEIRELLAKAGMPCVVHSADSVPGNHLLDRAGEDGSRLPVLFRYDGKAFIEPTRSEVLEAIGMRTRPGSDTCDVVVLGAGPAGLAAGVYGSSEGLDVIVLESEMTGGQAATSSLIRNYLGFAHGISGRDFAVEACEQTWLFGADLVLSQTATELRVDGPDRTIRTEDGTEVTARALVIATGVTWRRLGVPPLEELIGAGVFYGAAGSEARAMTGQDVCLVGAGNSAGQAAINLAKYANSVTMLVRGASLGTSMSRYLITEIEQSPNILVRTRTQVVGGGGDGHLEWLELLEQDSGASEVVEARALFVMIGAEPRTDWLADSVLCDAGGYILTGRDLAADTRAVRAWPLDRPPLPLETSVPGVFAAGDIRSNSVKRVASAVGEGATAVQMLHEYFREP